MKIKYLAIYTLVAILAGCGGEPAETVDDPAPDSQPPPPARATAPAPAETPLATPNAETPPAGGGVPDVARGEPVKAGIGARSKNLEGDGYLRTTVRAIPFAEESMQFAQAQRALQLYKAANDGRGPATHEEYMEKIIKENLIRLPELPAGHEYRYDPETEQLLDVETGGP